MLQEVAAARHILIVYSSTKIDGYAFYLSVNFFFTVYLGLESSLRPIIYLMSGVIFRPKHAMSLLGSTSLGIGSLGELIDMFHSHEATKLVDKVYALLGMSSGVGLVPDYQIPFEDLLRSLVKLLLCEQVSVETCGNK